MAGDATASEIGRVLPPAVGMRLPNFETPGAWQELFARAMTLVDHLGTVVNEPLWSFGGGTVLMLRLDHRLSKDIDLFVPDPQYLGYVSPRLSDPAENLTHDYQEGAIFVKLYLAAGKLTSWSVLL